MPDMSDANESNDVGMKSDSVGWVSEYFNVAGYLTNRYVIAEHTRAKRTKSKM